MNITINVYEQPSGPPQVVGEQVAIEADLKETIERNVALEHERDEALAELRSTLDLNDKFDGMLSAEVAAHERARAESSELAKELAAALRDATVTCEANVQLTADLEEAVAERDRLSNEAAEWRRKCELARGAQTGEVGWASRTLNDVAIAVGHKGTLTSVTEAVNAIVAVAADRAKLLDDDEKLVALARTERDAAREALASVCDYVAGLVARVLDVDVDPKDSAAVIGHVEQLADEWAAITTELAELRVQAEIPPTAAPSFPEVAVAPAEPAAIPQEAEPAEQLTVAQPTIPPRQGIGPVPHVSWEEFDSWRADCERRGAPSGDGWEYKRQRDAGLAGVAAAPAANEGTRSRWPEGYSRAEVAFWKEAAKKAGIVKPSLLTANEYARQCEAGTLDRKAWRDAADGIADIPSIGGPSVAPAAAVEPPAAAEPPAEARYYSTQNAADFHALPAPTLMTGVRVLYMPPTPVADAFATHSPAPIPAEVLGSKERPGQATLWLLRTEDGAEHTAEAWRLRAAPAVTAPVEAAPPVDGATPLQEESSLSPNQYLAFLLANLKETGQGSMLRAGICREGDGRWLFRAPSVMRGVAREVARSVGTGNAYIHALSGDAADRMDSELAAAAIAQHFAANGEPGPIVSPAPPHTSQATA